MYPVIASLTSYQVMLLSALFAVIIIGYIYSRKQPVSFQAFIEMLSFMRVGAIIGAKLLSLITRIAEYGFSAEEIMAPGGLVFYGGLLLSIPAAYLGGRIIGYGTDYIFDHMAFLMPFAHGLGRIGCFLVGCCYGIPYSGPFCVVFPEGGRAPSGIPLFPVQLLEAVLLFALSGYLLFHYSLKGRHGALICYLGSYAVMRFVLEFLRGDWYRGIFCGLSTAQWISIAIILFLSICRILKRSRFSA